MTGFGSGKAPFGEGYVVLEIKSVNHRFLEVRSRSPRELLAGEAVVEKLLRSRLHRGYCMVNIWYEGSVGGTTAIDQGALKSHLDSLVQVAEDTKLCLTDLVGVLAGAPDIFTTPRIDDQKVLVEAIEWAFGGAISTLIGMREAEGKAMEKELLFLAENLECQMKTLDKESKRWPQRALKRLKERISSLTDGIEIQVDEHRIASEVAMLVDRADVTEEIARLGSHIEQLRSVVRTSEPVGRKLEFLIQELGREANTIASKASMPEISSVVVEVKAELEKMREIAQNIE